MYISKNTAANYYSQRGYYTNTIIYYKYSSNVTSSPCSLQSGAGPPQPVVLLWSRHVLAEQDVRRGAVPPPLVCFISRL